MRRFEPLVRPDFHLLPRGPIPPPLPPLGAGDGEDEEDETVHGHARGFPRWRRRDERLEDAGLAVWALSTKAPAGFPNSSASRCFKLKISIVASATEATSNSFTSSASKRTLSV